MMNIEEIQRVRKEFTEGCFRELLEGEQVGIELSAENSTFARFNQSRVRQIGSVHQLYATVTLYGNKRSACLKTTVIPESLTDSASSCIELLRSQLKQLPEDPYFEPLKENITSSTENVTPTLNDDALIKEIVEPLQGYDSAGIYTGGLQTKSFDTNTGVHHWFAKSDFTLDLSLILPNHEMSKLTYAADSWSTENYRERVSESVKLHEILNRPRRTLSPGNYRTYFTPRAASCLIGMLQWGVFSERAIQDGMSFARNFREKSLTLSPKVTLLNDFSLGNDKRFDQTGHLIPEELTLVKEGNFIQSFVSERSAKEYQLKPNGAGMSEAFQAPRLVAGELPAERAFQELGTGLYVTNLHYLNWSDRIGGRITGMTRYACVWVEDGELVEPISTMRFDDTLPDLLGEKLVALTTAEELIPDVGSYEERSLGGLQTPGLLVDDFTLVL